MNYILEFYSSLSDYIYDLFDYTPVSNTQYEQPRYYHTPTDDEIDNYLENVKKEMKIEKDIKNLEIRYKNLITKTECDEDKNVDDNDDNNNDNNNDGALKIKKKVSITVS